eukprot:scaffold249_cov262-Chaetoceros_neogracile.AAC.23
MHSIQRTNCLGSGQETRQGGLLLSPGTKESQFKPRKRKRLVKKKLQLELHEAQVEKWLESTGRFPQNRWKVEQKRTMKVWFERIDKDGSGEIDVDELADPLLSTGLAKTMTQVSNLVKEIDGDESSGIDFQEFLVVMKKDNIGSENQSSHDLSNGPENWSAMPNNNKQGNRKKDKDQRTVKNPIVEFTRRQDSEHMDLKSVVSRERRKLLLDATMSQIERREKAYEQINRWRSQGKLKDVSTLIQRLEVDRVENESFVEAMTEMLSKMQTEDGRSAIDENQDRHIRTPAHQAMLKERNVSMLRRENEKQVHGLTRRAIVYPRTRNPSLPSLMFSTIQATD